MSEELKKKISDLQPSSDGRWFHEGQEVFLELAESLLAHGFTEEEAGNLLEDAYRTVANEFGE